MCARLVYLLQRIHCWAGSVVQVCYKMEEVQCVGQMKCAAQMHRPPPRTFASVQTAPSSCKGMCVGVKANTAQYSHMHTWQNSTETQPNPDKPCKPKNKHWLSLSLRPNGQTATTELDPACKLPTPKSSHKQSHTAASARQQAHSSASVWLHDTWVAQAGCSLRLRAPGEQWPAASAASKEAEASWSLSSSSSCCCCSSSLS